jgi:hypothetical protein
MLVAASVADRLATPLRMAQLVRPAQDPEVLGTQPISAGLAAGWTAVAIIGPGVLVVASAGRRHPLTHNPQQEPPRAYHRQNNHYRA